MPWAKGVSGNPKGPPKGYKQKYTRTVTAVMDRYDFDPFEAKVKLCQQLFNKLRNNHFVTSEEKLSYLSLYADVLKDLLQYCYPKLKQIDHFAHVEILQKLESLDTIPDVELDGLIAEAEELLSASRSV